MMLGPSRIHAPDIQLSYARYLVHIILFWYTSTLYKLDITKSLKDGNSYTFNDWEF
jgi:hypothetical protein